LTLYLCTLKRQLKLKNMYPEYLVEPMRAELTKVGFEEMKTAADVDNAIGTEGTVFVVVNSVCGCAAANARPAARLAAANAKHPDKLITVFAGMEKEAVDRARGYMMPFPPSSPAMALFKDGKLVHMIERHQIEGRPAQMIADSLVGAFDQYC
jgi:putative YphP/YqiW family bacilliredoxin